MSRTTSVGAVMSRTPTIGATGRFAGDGVVRVELDGGVAAVGLGDVRLEDGAAVGVLLHAVDGGVGVGGGDRSLDLGGVVTGERLLCGTCHVTDDIAQLADG